MKLSIVIICWNDSKHIIPCIESIYEETRSISFEIIVADNASTDGSPELVRKHFPKVRLVETGGNIGYGPGNNVGFKVARGEYVLILNPDTLVHERALEKLVAFADFYPEAGAFGCRVLMENGKFQGAAQPLPTVFGYLVRALNLRGLGRFSAAFDSDMYVGWEGGNVREIGFQAGCCLLIRAPLLRNLEGFDPQFLHQYEDADLCHRVWNMGRKVLYCPDARITHIGGHQRGTYSLKVVLETERSKVRYFYKHYGLSGAEQIRWVALIELLLRYAGYRLRGGFKPDETTAARLKTYRTLLRWYAGLKPARFVRDGVEVDVGVPPLLSTLISSRVAPTKQSSPSKG
jgi:GT2 family glycosyltransferase